jgi:hypothetical protein
MDNIKIRWVQSSPISVPSLVINGQTDSAKFECTVHGEKKTHFFMDLIKNTSIEAF